MLQAFEAALENEDYELASNLRDRAGVGLCGWWACSKGDEPAGHLLWVEPAFGRFVGTYFSARELAELTVRPAGSGSAVPLLPAASRECRPSPAASADMHSLLSARHPCRQQNAEAAQWLQQC